MAAARLYVPITAVEFARLKEFAWPDRRPPAQMAAYLLARAMATYEQHRAPSADEPFPRQLSTTEGEAKRVSA